MNSTPPRVLMYHRVVDPVRAVGGNPTVVSATPMAFDRQMRHLARHYRVVSADEVLAAFREGRPLPQRSVLLTFDDGYRDFGDIAWPIMRRYRLPATLFVATGYPDHPEREFWWDRLARVLESTERSELDCVPCGRLSLHTPAARRVTLRILKRVLKTMAHATALRVVDDICRELGETKTERVPVLTWNELRELAADGATLAPHTQTHPALTRLAVEEARAEIRNSRDDLVREVGRAAPVFSYPYGDHNDAVVQIVRDEGFEVAVTCLNGHSPVPTVDPLRLRRTNVTMRTTPLVFGVRLTKYASYVDGWRLAAKEWRAKEGTRAIGGSQT